jgi:hypothetical protein
MKRFLLILGFSLIYKPHILTAQVNPQLVYLASDTIKQLRGTALSTGTLHRGIYSYFSLKATDNARNTYLFVKVDTSGKTIWSSQPMNYIEAGVVTSNYQYQRLFIGSDQNIYCQLNVGPSLGRINDTTGSMDWLITATNLLGGARLDMIDYDNTSFLFGSASSGTNKIRIARYRKQDGANMGYIDVTSINSGIFQLFSSNGNIYIASQDSCYKYESFDNPVLIWKTKLGTETLGDVFRLIENGSDLLVIGRKSTGFLNGKTICIDKTSGVLRWQLTNAGNFDLNLANYKIRNGFLYMTWEHKYVGSITERCLVNKVDLATGGLMWQVNHPFRTQYVTASVPEAMMSLDIDNNEMIYLTGYALPDNYTVQSWVFMKIRGSDGGLLAKNYLPDLSPLTGDFPGLFSIHLVDNKPYCYGFRNSTLAKVLLDTSQLQIIQNDPVKCAIQFSSKIIGIKKFSNAKNIIVKRIGKSFQISLVDLAYNSIWNKTIDDTLSYWYGNYLLDYNDSTKRIYVPSKHYPTQADNFFFWYYGPTPDAMGMLELDSLGNRVSTYFFSSADPHNSWQFFKDSTKRTFYAFSRNGTITAFRMPYFNPWLDLRAYYFLEKPYPLYKPNFFYPYSKDTIVNFCDSGPGGWGPAGFVKQWNPFLGSYFKVYPILTLRWINHVEAENKFVYYVVGKDSSDMDMIFKYRVSDSSVAWTQKFISSITTHKVFFHNSSLYTVSTQNGNILLRKFDSGTGNSIWSQNIPVPPNNYLKLVDFVFNHVKHTLTLGGNLIDTLKDRYMSSVFAITYDTSGNIIGQYVNSGYKVWPNRVSTVEIGPGNQTLVGGQISDSAHGSSAFILAMDAYAPGFVTPYVNWTGRVSNDWHNPLNWSNGIVPNANTHVIINTGTPYSPVINFDVAIGWLTLNPGVNLVVNPSAKVDIIHSQ